MTDDLDGVVDEVFEQVYSSAEQSQVIYLNAMLKRLDQIWGFGWSLGGHIMKHNRYPMIARLAAAGMMILESVYLAWDVMGVPAHDLFWRHWHRAGRQMRQDSWDQLGRRIEAIFRSKDWILGHFEELCDLVDELDWSREEPPAQSS